MMDMAVWQEYLKLLDNLGNTLEKLTEIERSKTAAVSGGNLHGVEECMKQEQVISLSLRGMDQKREKMLAQLEVQSLSRKYEVFRSASEVARNTLECNLHAIEQVQKAKDAPPLEDQPRQADFRA